MFTRLLTLTALLTTMAQAPRPYVPPRTPWGDPDLQGICTNKFEQSTPLERPDEFVGRRVQDVTGAELLSITRAEHERSR